MNQKEYQKINEIEDNFQTAFFCDIASVLNA